MAEVLVPATGAGGGVMIMGLSSFRKQSGEPGVAGEDNALTAVRDAAMSAKDWTAPRIEAFVEWITPRLEQLYAEGVRTAAPQVQKAVDRTGPAVDAAADKIVDELLPRLVAAVNAAADRAGAASGDVAADLTTKAAELSTQSGETKSHTTRNVLITLAVAAGVGAAAAAWVHSRSAVDPWAEPWEPAEDAANRAQPTQQVTPSNRIEAVIGDTAEAVGEAAGTAVARGREATRKAGERLAEAKVEIEEKLAEAREEIEVKIAETRDDLEEKVAETREELGEKITEVKETARRRTRKAPVASQSETSTTADTTDTVQNPPTES